MLAFYSAFEAFHSPKYEIDKGNIVDYLEKKERSEVIFKALKADGDFEINETDDVLPRAFVESIHDPAYVKFLHSTMKLKGEVIPDVYRYDSRIKLYDLPPEIMAGYYAFDDGAPFMKHTFSSAIHSASSAYFAAKSLLESKKSAYALCRPPGHHATRSQAGGFCYLNNAAVAAQLLSEQGSVLIIDIDFHHGNGTQSIFYERSDVFYFSLHGNPDKNYPYFTGREEETGMGNGEGFNLNIPLQNMCGNSVYLNNLSLGLRRVLDRFTPDFLVISAGFDTMKDDREGNFDLDLGTINLIGKALNELKVPAVIVQEGGYDLNNLSKAVPLFLSNFL